MSQKKQKTTLTNIEIDAATNALNRLASSTKDIVLRFRILQNLNTLSPVAEAYANSRRNIIKDNGALIENDQFVTDESGGIQFAAEEGSKKALAEIKALSEIDTEIEYQPLSLSRFAMANVDLDYSILVPLQWMIIDDVEE